MIFLWGSWNPTHITVFHICQVLVCYDQLRERTKCPLFYSLLLSCSLRSTPKQFSIKCSYTTATTRQQLALLHYRAVCRHRSTFPRHNSLCTLNSLRMDQQQKLDSVQTSGQQVIFTSSTRHFKVLLFTSEFLSIASIERLLDYPTAV